MQTKKARKHKPSLLNRLTQPWPAWAKPLTLFLGGQWISMLGSSVVQFSIFWYILRSTNSGALLALGVACSFLPQALITPVAEAWAERFPRKRLIMIADFGIALATLAMATLYLTGNGSLEWLFVLSAVRGLGSGIHAPAVNAVLVQMTPPEHLPRVNSISTSLQTFTALIPPVVSAWMLSAMSLAYVFFLDVGTALVGSVLLGLIRLPKQTAPAEPPRRPWHSLREGWLYAWSTQPVRALLGFYLLAVLLTVPVSMLTPLIVQRAFGVDYWLLTELEIAYGLGAMLGGAFIALRGGWKNRARTLLIATVVLGALTALLGISAQFWLFLMVMAVIGFCVPQHSAPCLSLLQAQVDPAHASQVTGLLQMATTLCFPLGMALFGPIADGVPTALVFEIAGLLLLALAAWMALNKAFAATVKADEPAAKPRAIEDGSRGGSAC